ncbi:MAG: hypothetical protein KME30_11225 [Iphinoe sp. HA4291-MV1]|nr:hypothetical protein [Iphinoe sp. HA4291-MV1]
MRIYTIVASLLIATAGVLSATSEVKANCVPVKGKYDSQITDYGTTGGVFTIVGVIKGAGFFSGDYIYQLISTQPAPPLDNTTVSSLGIVTITTSKGKIVLKNFNIANLAGGADFGTKVDGAVVDFNDIDPVQSTGTFQGATGVIFSTGFAKFNQEGNPIGYSGDVHGEVCIPNHSADNL